ncbi:hypothetical protein GGQ94_002075 [Petrimonas sulfuriphila]
MIGQKTAKKKCEAIDGILKETQRRPGIEEKMKPEPESSPKDNHIKLKGKIALVTGGDSWHEASVGSTFV